VCGAHGEYVNTFFNPVASCFLYKAKDVSVPARISKPLYVFTSARPVDDPKLSGLSACKIIVWKVQDWIPEDILRKNTFPFI
jgi:hypothetical protein